ncbi:MAG: ABC transporter permease, partial [Conexibacter sp.]
PPPPARAPAKPRVDAPAAARPLPGGRRNSALAPGHWMAPAGALLIGAIVLAALLAPIVAPYPADGSVAIHPTQALQAPSGAHWLGTDHVGRDVLTRIIYGARTSLLIVVAVLAVAGVAGTTLGIVAGYAGGWVRDVIMRVADVFLAFPALLLAVALSAILRPSLRTLIIAIAVTWWPWYCRLAASMAATIRQREYVAAGRCLGVGDVKLVFRHVLPNSLTPVLVQLSLDAGGVILTAAALSYLSLGVQEPTAEWGLMIQQNQTVFTTDWWAVVFPGLAIVLTTFGFNMLGEGLRARLDPRRMPW